MARKDVSDLLVCKIYKERSSNNKLSVVSLLQKITGQPHKVCYRAMERAMKKGYIEYGVSLQSGWLTEKGEKLILDHENIYNKFYEDLLSNTKLLENEFVEFLDDNFWKLIE